MSIDVLKGKSQIEIGLALKEKRRKREEVFKFLEWIRSGLEISGSEYIVISEYNISNEIGEGYQEFINNWYNYDFDLEDYFGLAIYKVPKFEETTFHLQA